MNLKDTAAVSEEPIPPALLVKRVGSGDSHAEAELIGRYSRSLMAMLICRTGDIQRAEDVHQETFCIVLQRLRGRGIDRPESISSFIHQTASNFLINEYRKEARRKTDADTDFVQKHRDTGLSQLEQLLTREAAVATRAAIQELRTDRDREILYRFYILQEEKQQICQTLGLSSAQFDTVISRARSRFRKVIDNKRPLRKKAGALA